MKIINFILFQLGWFVTIYAAAHGMPYVGVVYTITWMLVHLFLMNGMRNAEFRFLLFAALIGYLLDSLLVVSEFIAFPEQTILAGPSPVWMVCLWINLAATINFSLSWLKERYALAGVMAAVAGPLAYAAGEKLGAITLFGNTSYLTVSIMWCLAMPLLIWASIIFTRQQVLQEQLMSIGMEKIK